MSSHSRWIRYLFSLASLCLVFFPAVQAPAQDMPASYVVDDAGIIDDSVEHRLNGHLQELEQKTGAQMIVLTVKSTGGVPIEEYALDKAEAWRLGQQGKDNGLLMVVAVNDRRYRIEVGYGLESIIPDSLAGTIARQYLLPAFKEGDYTQGIYATSVALIQTIARASNVQLTGMPAIQAVRTPAKKSSPLGSLLSFLIFIIIFSTLFSGRSRGLFGALLLGSLLGGSRSGMRNSGGFGSFGGGGFGSFGGGMGGGFGGGGVSGGW